MRRHLSWDAPPLLSARVSGHYEGLYHSSPTLRVYAPPSRLRLPFDTSSPVPTISGLFNPVATDPWASPLCVPCPVSAVSPWTKSVTTDRSSKSSGASPAVRATATSHSSRTTSTTSAAFFPRRGGASAIGGKVKKKRIRAKTERRREQCRRNQARYRTKQKRSSSQLERSVEQLRLDVKQLQQHRESLNCDAAVSVSRGNLVRTLFRLFRFGLNVGCDEARCTTTKCRDRPSLEHQIAFVTAFFHPDLCVGDQHGRMLLLEQMRRFSTFFEELETFPDPLVPQWTTGASSELIQLTFRLALTISTTTLRAVFPHLVRAEHHEIRWRLLGRRLCCPASAVLVLGYDGYVVELSWTIDWVAALTTVLTIEETAVVLQHARIERDAYLTVTGEEVTPIRSAASRTNRTSRWGEPPLWIWKQKEADREQDDEGLVFHEAHGDYDVTF